MEQPNDAGEAAQQQATAGRLVRVICIHDGPQAMIKRQECLDVLRAQNVTILYVDEVIPGFTFRVEPGRPNPLDDLEEDKETLISEAKIQVLERRDA